MPHHHPYSTVEGDIWALGCILAEMIDIRPWKVASPEDRNFSDYLMDRAILLDVLPVSDGAYSLLTKMFSPRPERRPSLDEIRRQVLAMDTFFLTDREAAICGWTDRLEKKLLCKNSKCRVPSEKKAPRYSDETSSGSCYPHTSLSSRSPSSSCHPCSLSSCYSRSSSSPAFESISLGSSAAPATPPTPAVETFCSEDKVVGLQWHFRNRHPRDFLID